jgi:GNAT superfamily N-acetyltransferase
MWRTAARSLNAAVDMTATFHLRSGRAVDLPVLQRIECAAAELFIGHGVPESVLVETTSTDDFQEALDAGLLWVAAGADDSPIGFACAEVLDEYVHLDEVDVDPKHGRRGVGAALVRAVCARAAEQGMAGVTLTTYRDISWNAPFYRRLGFEELEAEELTSALREVVREEATRGLEPERRMVMRWRASAV